MEAPGLRKVTARIDHSNVHSVSRPNPSRLRPSSPLENPQPSLSPPPIFKPKAKLSSSATVRKLSSTSSLTNGNRPIRIASPAPSRPVSPSRPPPSPSSQSLAIKARVTARPASKSVTAQSNISAHSLGGAKELFPTTRPRGSTGNSALQNTLSTLQIPSSPQPSPLSDRSFTFDSEAGLNKPLKIKARVSGVVKAIPSAVESTSPQPPWATTRPIAQHRARTPSVTSTFSQSPPRSRTPDVPYYPITTAAPAANPHRYASSRQTPHSPHLYQSFTTRDSEPFSDTRSITAKVESNSVPLPPLSPPSSALSLSSRSSFSRSSISYKTDGSEGSKASASTVGSHINDGRASRLVSPLPGSSPEQDMTLVNDRRASPSKDSSDVESEGSEHKARAKAKTNRKIADLEITNRSLLAINATLESTKHRQAKEIRDLRRKLREARLALSPKQFKAVKAEDQEEEEPHEEEESDTEEEEVYVGEQDEMFLRVKSMVEGLVASGKAALETRPTDYGERGTTRVLHADEVQHWRDFSGRGAASDILSQGGTDDLDDDATTRMSSSYLNVPDTDHGFMSEDEVEALATDVDSPHQYAELPPITITSPS